MGQSIRGPVLTTNLIGKSILVLCVVTFVFRLCDSFFGPNSPPLVWCVRHFISRLKNGRDCGCSWRLLIEREVMFLRKSRGHDIHLSETVTPSGFGWRLG